MVWEGKKGVPQSLGGARVEPGPHGSSLAGAGRARSGLQGPGVTWEEPGRSLAGVQRARKGFWRAWEEPGGRGRGGCSVLEGNDGALEGL